MPLSLSDRATRGITRVIRIIPPATFLLRISGAIPVHQIGERARRIRATPVRYTGLDWYIFSLVRPLPIRADGIVTPAACHATLSELAGRAGSDVPLVQKEVEAAKAMELLNSNLSDYYPHPLLLIHDRGFESLRDRADFKQFHESAPIPTKAAPR
jgi:hypothetical protein